jgi:hypothetical protein
MVGWESAGLLGRGDDPAAAAGGAGESFPLPAEEVSAPADTDKAAKKKPDDKKNSLNIHPVKK